MRPSRDWQGRGAVKGSPVQPPPSPVGSAPGDPSSAATRPAEGSVTTGFGRTYPHVLIALPPPALALPPGHKGPHLQGFSPRQEGSPAAMRTAALQPWQSGVGAWARNRAATVFPRPGGATTPVAHHSGATAVSCELTRAAQHGIMERPASTGGGSARD